MREKHWIENATRNKGKLHERLGVPKGKKIPAKKLHKAEKAGGKLGEEARLAKTLSKLKR